jgi:undecaprenyl diphosphate synthase
LDFSALSLPLAPQPLPQHVAIIMDGNRRWAKKRFMPAAMGHAAGAKRVREIVQACASLGIPHLSVFAFSTENWKRPEDEVSSLMGLFMTYLQKEVDNMNANGVRLKVVGDLSRFSLALQELIAKAEELTTANTRITLTVCANYGGRWDMVQAAKAWQLAHPHENLQALTEEALAPYLSTAYAPEVDLLIRTGGESRVSNFLLWQAAYAELFFTDDLWPDFSPARLQQAVVWFAGRDRRFGSSAPL